MRSASGNPVSCRSVSPRSDDVVAIATSTYAIFQRPDSNYNTVADRIDTLPRTTGKKVAKKPAKKVPARKK